MTAGTNKRVVATSANWSITQTKNHLLENVLDFPIQEQENVERLLIASSFFLPGEVLSNPRYKISPIFCMKRADFTNTVNKVPPKSALTLPIKCDCNLGLLEFAKFIGVSCRTDLITRERFLVLKLWYGNYPELTTTEQCRLYSRKLLAFTNFILNQD